MNIPIFYSLKTGLITSWIVPADENESALIKLNPPDGQGVVVISEKEYGNLETLQSLVTQTTGLQPVFDRSSTSSAANPTDSINSRIIRCQKFHLLMR